MAPKNRQAVPKVVNYNRAPHGNPFEQVVEDLCNCMCRLEEQVSGGVGPEGGDDYPVLLFLKYLSPCLVTLEEKAGSASQDHCVPSPSAASATAAVLYVLSPIMDWLCLLLHQPTKHSLCIGVCMCQVRLQCLLMIRGWQ